MKEIHIRYVDKRFQTIGIKPDGSESVIDDNSRGDMKENLAYYAKRDYPGIPVKQFNRQGQLQKARFF